jgi:hypothetical protein
MRTTPTVTRRSQPTRRLGRGWCVLTSWLPPGGPCRQRRRPRRGVTCRPSWPPNRRGLPPTDRRRPPSPETAGPAPRVPTGPASRPVPWLLRRRSGCRCWPSCPSWPGCSRSWSVADRAALRAVAGLASLLAGRAGRDGVGGQRRAVARDRGAPHPHGPTLPAAHRPAPAPLPHPEGRGRSPAAVVVPAPWPRPGAPRGAERARRAGRRVPGSAVAPPAGHRPGRGHQPGPTRDRRVEPPSSPPRSTSLRRATPCTSNPAWTAPAGASPASSTRSGSRSSTTPPPPPAASSTTPRHRRRPGRQPAHPPHPHLPPDRRGHRRRTPRTPTAGPAAVTRADARRIPTRMTPSVRRVGRCRR